MYVLVSESLKKLIFAEDETYRKQLKFEWILMLLTTEHRKTGGGQILTEWSSYEKVNSLTELNENGTNTKTIKYRKQNQIHKGNQEWNNSRWNEEPANMKVNVLI
jgi:hypothetical protein